MSLEVSPSFDLPTVVADTLDTAPVAVVAPLPATEPAVEPIAEPANGFATLCLAPELLRALSRAGYTEPTGVQLRAIPAALAGSDLMVSSQTGSGKTAAFVLPALQRVLDARRKQKKP